MKGKIVNILFALLLGIAFTGFAQDNPLNIVGNPGSVPEMLEMNQLQSILRGEQLRWGNGIAVKIALMKTNTVIGSHTCTKIYKMSANELNKYFLAQVFQGRVKAPVFFTSKTELESYVARTPGAIGVSQDAIEGDVTIVVVDGKKQI